MKDVLVNGQWIHPALKICPVCQGVIHEFESECMICKDLGMKAEMKRIQQAEHQKCPTCGEFLTHGHCQECNVQVILT